MWLFILNTTDLADVTEKDAWWDVTRVRWQHTAVYLYCHHKNFALTTVSFSVGLWKLAGMSSDRLKSSGTILQLEVDSVV